MRSFLEEAASFDLRGWLPGRLAVLATVRLLTFSRGHRSSARAAGVAEARCAGPGSGGPWLRRPLFPSFRLCCSDFLDVSWSAQWSTLEFTLSGLSRFEIISSWFIPIMFVVQSH